MILEAFHRTCAPLFEQAESNRVQSRTLATLRDTLLPKLLSGELFKHISSIGTV
jgi:type I restriction enzyme S subunit